jgi:acetyl-CoA acetyltransferase family protein
MTEAVIVGAVRTPVGRYGGALKDVRPDDLAALVIRALLERTGVAPESVDEVVFGCTNQAGEDNRNVARMALILAGLPETVPGQTVNRLCASGLQAVNTAATCIQAGLGEIYIAGGVESMTRAPMVMAKPSGAFPRGRIEMEDSTIGWRFVNPRMADCYEPISLGETAENVAERYEVSRERQDQLALTSHQKAVAAIREGRFTDEIVAVSVPQPRGADPKLFDTDDRSAGQAPVGVPQGRDRDCRQLLGRQRRRCGAAAHVGRARPAARPQADGPLRCLRGGGRQPPLHGHRPHPCHP